MPSQVALLLWMILLLALLRFDPAKAPGTSTALWVPLIWLFITATRLPSQWLGGSTGSAAQAFEDGNPLDRAVFTTLILLAIVILVLRAFNWGSFFYMRKGERNYSAAGVYGLAPGCRAVHEPGMRSRYRFQAVA